jgi:hypothetical protein
MYEGLIKERLSSRKIIPLERATPDAHGRDSHVALMVGSSQGRAAGSSPGFVR